MGKAARLHGYRVKCFYVLHGVNLYGREVEIMILADDDADAEVTAQRLGLTKVTVRLVPTMPRHAFAVPPQ